MLILATMKKESKFQSLVLMKENFFFESIAEHYAETSKSRVSEVYYHSPSQDHWCPPESNAKQYQREQDIIPKHSKIRDDDELQFDCYTSTKQSYLQTKPRVPSPCQQYMPHREKVRNQHRFEESTTRWQNSSFVDKSATAYEEDYDQIHANPPETSRDARLINLCSKADVSPKSNVLQLKDAVDLVADVSGDRLPTAHWHTIGWIGIYASTTLH